MDSNDDGIGDLNGVISKLDYLKNLGVTHVWLSPIFESPNKDLGYDVSDYYKINKEYGTMDDLIKLIKKAHELDIKIILDFVLNHTSDKNKYFLEALENKDSKYREYFFFADKPLNNLGSQFGGSAWHEVNGEYYLGLFSKYQVDFNYNSKNLRNEILDILEYYLKMGVDGFRFDVISLISKPKKFIDYEINESLYSDFKNIANGKNIFKYLKEISTLLKKYGAISIGEGSGLTPKKSLKYYKYLDFVFTFDLMNTDGSETYKWNNRLVTVKEIKEVLKFNSLIHDSKRPYTLFLDNHDQPRYTSRFADKDIPFYSNSLILSLVYLLKGTIFCFQGDEIGMTNYNFKSGEELIDIESKNIFASFKDKKEILSYINLKARDHGRTPMHWDDSLNAGFTKNTPWSVINPNYLKINVSKFEKDQSSILSYFKKIINLKRRNLPLKFGKVKFINVSLPLIIYNRIYKSHQIMCVFNYSKEIISIDLKNNNIIFSNYQVNDNSKLKPYEVRIIQVK
jgi:oligo-1,6-glucosidase